MHSGEAAGNNTTPWPDGTVWVMCFGIPLMQKIWTWENKGHAGLVCKTCLETVSGVDSSGFGMHIIVVDPGKLQFYNVSLTGCNEQSKKPKQ